MLLVACSAAGRLEPRGKGRGVSGVARRAAGILGGLGELKDEQDKEEAWLEIDVKILGKSWENHGRIIWKLMGFFYMEP